MGPLKEKGLQNLEIPAKQNIGCMDLHLPDDTREPRDHSAQQAMTLEDFQSRALKSFFFASDRPVSPNLQSKAMRKLYVCVFVFVCIIL